MFDVYLQVLVGEYTGVNRCMIDMYLQVLVGEYTGVYTFLSLIPIMMGLALCSAYELSFNFPGFISALITNLSEW